MTQALLALASWFQLALMLALVTGDPRELAASAKLRIGLAAAILSGTEAWCLAQPFGSPLRFVPLVPALAASYAVFRSAARIRDVRAATSYLFALTSALALREFSLTANALAQGLGTGLALVLPLAALWAYDRLARERYLAMQAEMAYGWLPTCAVFAALAVLVYLLAYVPTPVASRADDYPQLVLGLVLAPLVQASVLGTVSGHFALMQAREREHVLSLSASRMAEAVQQAAEGERQLSIRRHDQRHHMAALDELMAAGETERARAYIQALAEDGS